MKRIYLECFIGLVLHLCLILVGYNYIVYDLNVDYDYLLEDFEGEALQNLVGTIYHNQGEEAALLAVSRYAKTTRQTLHHSPNPPKEVKTFFQHTSPQSYTYHDEDRVLWFRFKLNDDIYSLRPDMNTPLRQSIKFDDEILWVFFVVGFGLYSIIFIWFLGRRIRSLEKATLSFANGEFDVRVSEKSSDKVGELNKNFNYMADKISSLIYTNKALTNAVAHELRTPIFRIQWQAERLQDSVLTTDNQKKVTSIIEDIDEMEVMVNELLYYAKVERADITLNVKETPLNQLLVGLVDKWRTSNDAVIEMDLSQNIEPHIEVSCDPYLLTQALNNLIGNGKKHCRTGVYMSSSVTRDSYTIVIEDDGNGIPKQHWPFIFDAFYTAEPSRNKQQVGFGLGLAIVKQIVSLHKGDISIGQGVHGGAKFSVTLPRSI